MFCLGGFWQGGFCPGVYVRGVFVWGVFVLEPINVTLWHAIDAQVKRFVIFNCLTMDLLSHLPSSHHSSQSSDWTIGVVNFLQTKNIFLQIAKCYLRTKLTCFMFSGGLNRLESKFKATEVIKQILFIYFVYLFCQ